jgi:hypothetical protein
MPRLPAGGVRKAPTGRARKSPAGCSLEGPAGYFQNMSMPPPTMSTPKPTARFQSWIGRGS